MQTDQRLMDALKKLTDQREQCHHELSREINISELKIKHIHYLEIIHKHEHLSFSQLAEILNITRPSVTGIVNQLIKLGLVFKQQCMQDGRVYYVKLTDKGEKVIQFQGLEQQRLACKIKNTLNPREITLFVELINKLVHPGRLTTTNNKEIVL